MTDKFNVRDIIVYTLSGIIFSTLPIYLFDDSVANFVSCNIAKIKDVSFIISLLLIPFFYIFGHLFHGIDLLIFYIFKDLHSYKNIFLRFFYQLFFGHRISYRIKKSGIKDDKFWTDVTYLQIKGLNYPPEYWYRMNDLFKGVYLFFSCLLVVSLSKCDYLVGLFSFIAAFISWFKAKMYATYFIKGVKRTTMATKIDMKQPGD